MHRPRIMLNFKNEFNATIVIKFTYNYKQNFEEDNGCPVQYYPQIRTK